LQIGLGEVVGIIGKNGAGKSTLLKVLSRVTAPTKGEVKIRGRIASLLEVGTGFHPELSGRENIYLNGAILGMRKKEISLKFDAIVDFAGVEEFIDTPVKRYSSGMYVRLAFAVAAHLDPEILIVDEVLAVGDAAFQNKCIGKMKSVASSGRTVLLVSHNMPTISSLCDKVIHLQDGRVKNSGFAADVVRDYLNDARNFEYSKTWKPDSAPGNSVAKLYSVAVASAAEDLQLDIHTPFRLEIEYELFDEISEPVPQVHVFNDRGECIFISYGHMFADQFIVTESYKAGKGKYRSNIYFPADIFNNGVINFSIGLVDLIFKEIIFYVEDAISIELSEDINKRDFIHKGFIGGSMRPKLEWRTIKL
jgi:lipopolysaccharide transport system ATP-binding protein